MVAWSAVQMVDMLAALMVDMKAAKKVDSWAVKSDSYLADYLVVRMAEGRVERLAE